MANKPKPDEPVTSPTELETATAEKGYMGTVPDPTPNEAYTVGGVLSSDTAAEADRAAKTGTTSEPE